jgi:hypothetical protein
MKNRIVKFNELISMEHLSNSSKIIIKIDKNDKKYISKRLNLIKLDNLNIDIIYNKIDKMELLAKYEIIATGEQKCVISLNPVKFKIKNLFSIKFIGEQTIDLSTLEDEFIEPIYNNNINFSEIGIQMLDSFLDTYPKINNGDIDLDRVYNNEDNSEINKNNPFEVLNNINK